MPDQWFVYKQTTSNLCKVQRPEERPLFGDQHLGPFNTKAGATNRCAKTLTTL